MSVTEQIGQLWNSAPAIDHLGIPAYEWLNDNVHGVGRTSQKATILPNGCGMGATWSRKSLLKAGLVLGQESRALHNFFLHNQSYRGLTPRCNGCGLTIYGPNLNLVKDPRWGRAQETFGEDPFLTGRLVVSWVTGAQNNSAGNSVGPDGKTILTGLCCKHFAACECSHACLSCACLSCACLSCVSCSFAHSFALSRPAALPLSTAYAPLCCPTTYVPHTHVCR
jgi:beta-glucosidase